MDAHTLKVLEYQKILNRLAAHTSNAMGREAALALEPTAYPEIVARRLQEARDEYERRVEEIAEVRRTVRHEATEEARNILRRASEKAENILDELRKMNRGGRKGPNARRMARGCCAPPTCRTTRTR